MRKGVVVALVAVAALVAVLVIGRSVVRQVGPLAGPEECTATVDGRSVTLSVEQAENAGLMAAIAVRRGMPARAVSIALATAYQESAIYNLESGDRDSVGLFQQRPSQGWGTVEEILDPVYSINAFYDALAEVEGYQSLEITVAAQAVQRSAFPGAYADHEADARVLAAALTGQYAAAFSCEIGDDVAEASDRLDDLGLTRRAEKMRTDVLGAFGTLSFGGYEPGGATSGHMEGSTHYEGRAVDIFVRPINEANTDRGWGIASYLVAQAVRLRIQTVIFDDQIWTARRSDEGWRDYDPDTSGVSAATAAILEHRDHVHVDVFD